MPHQQHLRVRLHELPQGTTLEHSINSTQHSVATRMSFQMSEGERAQQSSASG